MIRIAGGSFMMGAAPMRAEEGPPRRARLDPFWIAATEVTNAQFARFIEATGYVTLAERPPDPAAYPGVPEARLRPSSLVFAVPGKADEANRAGWRIIDGASWRRPEGPGSTIEGREHWPVTHVAWDDAIAYARWLGHDLPTEAEWEYAARGGLQGAAFVWGDSARPAKRPLANYWQGPFPLNDHGEDGYAAQTAPVACYPPNGYGLYDMAGNVWEWARDWYRPGLAGEPVDNPTGPAEVDAYDPADPHVRKHVIKGGSFLCADSYCLRYRPAARQPGPTDTGSSHLGFRTVFRGPSR